MEKSCNVSTNNNKLINNIDVNNCLNLLKISQNKINKVNIKNLLSLVDPDLNNFSIVEEIKKYVNMIEVEINNIKCLNNKLNEEKRKLISNNKTLEKLIKPNKDNYIYSRKYSETITGQAKQFDNQFEENSKIDNKIYLNNLENEVVLYNQKINNVKCINVSLSKELNELRKNLIINKSKITEKVESTITLEKNYKAALNDYKKKMILSLPSLNSVKNKNYKLVKTNKLNKDSSSCINKSIYLSTDIIEKDKLLNKKKDKFVENIVKKDEEIVRKLARLRYYNNELNLLEKKEEDILKYYKSLEEKFFKDNKFNILKYRECNYKSELIDSLCKIKLDNIQEMLSKIELETGLNNLDSIIKYFAKSILEYNSFSNFYSSLSKNVYKLEDEVESLEYIINLCEKNLNIEEKNIVSNIKNNQINTNYLLSENIKKNKASTTNLTKNDIISKESITKYNGIKISKYLYTFALFQKSRIIKNFLFMFNIMNNNLIINRKEINNTSFSNNLINNKSICYLNRTFSLDFLFENNKNNNSNNYKVCYKDILEENKEKILKNHMNYIKYKINLYIPFIINTYSKKAIPPNSNSYYNKNYSQYESLLGTNINKSVSNTCHYLSNLTFNFNKNFLNDNIDDNLFAECSKEVKERLKLGAINSKDIIKIGRESADIIYKNKEKFKQHKT